MKTLITVLALALSIAGAHANSSDDVPFTKFASVEEELINPFDNNIQLASLEDTIRKDREITESDIEIPDADPAIDQVIAQDIKITDAQLPAYQPLDWNQITRSHRVVKTVIHINRKL